MTKKIILTEGDLSNIVGNVVKRVLTESSDDFGADGTGSKSWLAIGFAEHYFTLWQITYMRMRVAPGCVQERTYFEYIKNISRDENTAFAKYPDAKYEPNLRGKTRSWSSSPKEVWTDVDTFRFGKYKYRKIDEVNDMGYTKWYYGAASDEEHKKYILSYLAKFGYTLYNGEIISNEEFERIKQQEENANSIENEMISSAESGATVPIFVTRNPGSNGEIYDEQRDMYFYFQNVAERRYNGYTYYVPTIKGKGKNVKNKTILAKLSIVVDDGWRQFMDSNEFYPPFRSYMSSDKTAGVDNEFETYEEAKAACEQFLKQHAGEGCYITLKDDYGEISNYMEKRMGKKLFYITDFVVEK